MKQDNIKRLTILADEIKNCTKCKLHINRINTVFSRGNPDANICFLAEAPGQLEDETGLPLVGRSGKLLDTAIEELGYNAGTDVYVCNPIKCRPPENRRPETDEINACFPYIEEQLSLINANVIVTLGSTAMQVLTDEIKGITKVRGNWYKWKDKDIKIVFHPSYILRNGGIGSEMFQQFKTDLQNAFDKAKELSNDK